MTAAAIKNTLSRKQREMLNSLREGPKLCGKWEWSGSRIPGPLLRAGLIRRIDHPSTIDRRSGFPAEAFELTEAGRAALEA